MTRTDRRNPWLMLGVDYGCAPAEASVGFARKSKVLRRMTEAPWDRADLAWALNEIEAAEADPATSVAHYRVPADRGAYEVSASDSPGLLRPPRPRVQRVLPPTTDDDLQIVIQTLLRAVLRQVLASPPDPTVLCPYAIDGEPPA